MEEQTKTKKNQSVEERNEEYYHIVNELMLTNPVEHLLLKFKVNEKGYGEKLEYFENTTTGYLLFLEKNLIKISRYATSVMLQKHLVRNPTVTLRQNSIDMDTGLPIEFKDRFDVLDEIVNSYSMETQGNGENKSMIYKSIMHDNTVRLLVMTLDISAIGNYDWDEDGGKRVQTATLNFANSIVTYEDYCNKYV
jgi:hypothetical protein